MILDMFMFVLCTFLHARMDHATESVGGRGGGIVEGSGVDVDIPWTCTHARCYVMWRFLELASFSMLLDVPWLCTHDGYWWMPRWHSMDLHTCSMLRHVDVPWTCTHAWTFLEHGMLTFLELANMPNASRCYSMWTFLALACMLDATASWRSLILHTWWMPHWRSMDLHTCSMLRHVDVPWTCTAWLSCFLFRVILQMSFKTPITFFQDNSDFTFWTETKNTMAQRYWFQINHIQRQTFSRLKCNESQDLDYLLWCLFSQGSRNHNQKTRTLKSTLTCKTQWLGRSPQNKEKTVQNDHKCLRGNHADGMFVNHIEHADCLILSSQTCMRRQAKTKYTAWIGLKIFKIHFPCSAYEVL